MSAWERPIDDPVIDAADRPKPPKLTDAKTPRDFFAYLVENIDAGEIKIATPMICIWIDADPNAKGPISVSSFSTDNFQAAGLAATAQKHFLWHAEESLRKAKL